MMESTLPEYDAFEVIRERTGSALPGIVPTNAYPCKDGQYVLVAGNGDSIFRRLMEAIGRPDLASDPSWRTTKGGCAGWRSWTGPSGPGPPPGPSTRSWTQ
jgi:formyl-CoA transferase